MAPSCGNCCACVGSVLFEYDTEKIVHIKNKKIGIINRVIQLVIIAYIIGFVIVYKKGYQEFESPYSSVTTKLKGVALTNLTGANLSYYGREFLWDSADLVIPPEEEGAVFMMTNMIITPEQSQGKCPEDPSVPGARCTADADCPPLQSTSTSHGVNTGNCVPSTHNMTVKTCELYAWCPIENDVTPMPGFNLSYGMPLLDAAKNFTLLIKNSVQFPKFSESRRNIIQKNDSHLKSCNYHPTSDPLCPVFRLGTMAELAGVNFEKLAYKGGVMAIVITWNCNFDPLAYHCEPKYSFRRLDDDESPIAPGYNFRFPRYYIKNETLYRTIVKAYGIRFVVTVYGKGGKFSVIPLFLNIGSGLALLGIATVLCDVFVLYVLRKKYFYREKKYLNVDDSDNEKADKVHSKRGYSQLSDNEGEMMK
ncbi:P2X purinoceptor 4 isoform X2 [Nematostella vectensis]|uniref:P2X purinoceptor 4 isoform X2 n=1 Tax=Nematostella vectensis TaxID=45351 RepID=UPI0020772F55|nr:P2X purinoceptor 4 isoform X2 [Nematostella vectensis]